MSQLNKLYRNFIILQEDERGYSNSNDKTLSGYSKIEAKGSSCKISFYAQNLRKDDEEYCILAICNKKDTKKVLNLGKISVSDGGKAEITKEYPLDNVGGLGISYDKISGAAIGKMKNGVPIIVMCGFINGEQPGDSWKNYSLVNCAHSKSKEKIEYMKKEEKKKKKKHRDGEIEEIEDIELVETEEEVKEEIERDDEVEKEPENEPEKEIQVNEAEVRSKEETINEVDGESTEREDIEGNEEETRNNIEEDDENNPFSKQNYNENPFNQNIQENLYGIEDLNRGYIKNKFDEYEEKLEEENTEFKVRGSVGEYFESLANGFEHCRDRYEEIKYCKWYKIPVNDLHEMCNMSNYNRYAVAYYPMLNYYPYIRKYKHFMLGYKCDENGILRYIVYGIPGEKNKDEQPYEGKTGFVTWVSDESRDGMGCWLMFYDFKNSTVVVPMQ
ncbi:hypothetical protein R0131_05005 [Clostridium sp. AL.422]|uniref:DUF7922 domain-containing protein n=1 Tax=Clostridium TaxID=1485 RepID=UPI00293DB14B|nr:MULTISPECIES: hypothetical protein [unclassified Clostridium]MDV4150192.1 hypothetical protein [Clostridium sp. AL.422]